MSTLLLLHVRHDCLYYVTLLHVLCCDVYIYIVLLAHVATSTLISCNMNNATRLSVLCGGANANLPVTRRNNVWNWNIYNTPDRYMEHLSCKQDLFCVY